MITITVRKGSDSLIRGFRIAGHAEYDEGPQEYDIVCASVSSVSLTAALGLKEVLHKKGRYETEDGFLAVDIGEGADDRTEAVIQTMLAGLREIQKQYPERIQFHHAGGESHVPV